MPLESNSTTNLVVSGNTTIPSAIYSPTQGLVPMTTVTGSNAGSSGSDSTSVGDQAAVASSPPALATSTTTVTSTVYLPASTVTATGSPQTVTDTITIIPPPTPSPSLAGTTSTTDSVHPTTWSAPPQMTDLSAFNVKHFASGQGNMRIIVKDPPTDSQDMALPSLVQGVDAIAETLAKTVAALVSAVVSGIIPPPPQQTSSSFLQLYYPADSIDPAQEPVGGADFYAAPLDVGRAKNVSLEYSVFFPSDFDWVEAGKLPGIYGGHEGCSGGDAATSCFSTRLMWRQEGLGELYLYAPKDKQTKALCATPPLSICDSEYGLSIGRGSFRFVAGNWTHVKQTVTLNTPGVQDGTFTLDVNGVRVIDRPDVFYRDVPSLLVLNRRVPFPGPAGDAGVAAPERAVPINVGIAHLPSLPAGRDTFPERAPADVDQDDAEPSAGIRMVALRDFTPVFVPYRNASGDPRVPGSDAAISPSAAASSPLSTSTSTVTDVITVVPPPQTVIVAPTYTETAYVVALETGIAVPPAEAISVKAAEPVGFSGLFFSTFFGGHERKYATPKDQFTWFKDFAMAINA
ncbi:hypothetical protein GSI_07395 [Ganoderma sinense ZZ0214-1]|uniref:Polysaccharide lyase 14 domain-containing protein n=1 Tax=Ganoderma sinense ZZ0214-1 TaxID=1077348 RepID=A0A2G8SAB1_9APHY|nr:hypothetical protein GSI_07395 [Ganoderma sinense ZZ0214-1]